jgi:hypothetical protein
MVSPVPQDDVMIMTSSQTEEIRHAAADRQFLEEIGLTPQAFLALLDGNGIEWDDDEDDDEDEDEDGEGEDEGEYEDEYEDEEGRQGVEVEDEDEDEEGGVRVEVEKVKGEEDQD